MYEPECDYETVVFWEGDIFKLLKQYIRVAQTKIFYKFKWIHFNILQNKDTCTHIVTT